MAFSALDLMVQCPPLSQSSRRPKQLSESMLGIQHQSIDPWRETNAVWDEVMTGFDMAELLDPAEPEVASVLASTRQILERLRAVPYLARLDTLMARTGREPSVAPLREVSTEPATANP